MCISLKSHDAALIDKYTNVICRKKTLSRWKKMKLNYWQYWKTPSDTSIGYLFIITLSWWSKGYIQHLRRGKTNITYCNASGELIVHKLQNCQRFVKVVFMLHYDYSIFIRTILYCGDFLKMNVVINIFHFVIRVLCS